MARGPELRTQRLRMRRWRQTDLDDFAAINADPDVMEHFPAIMTRDETARMIARIEYHFQEHGFGLWAVEHGSTGQLLGFAGLAVPNFDAYFTPAVEVGWRFSKQSWGSGFATEAARAAMRYGFEEAGLDEIVSFTIPANVRSIGVMERLGMTHDPKDDFDHPNVEDPRVVRHVLYRMPKETWAAANA